MKKIPTTYNTEHLSEIGFFLADYAAWLLGSGATCIRIEKNVRRMAEAFHVHLTLALMPSTVFVSVWQNNPTEAVHHNCAHHKGCISFYIITQLSKLSWEVADGKTDFEGARLEMTRMVEHPQHTGRWTVLLLASLANASFCRLFQGDAASMLIVFIATVAGYFLKQVMLEDKHDVRLTFFCSAFFSSVIAAGGYVFGWGNTPDIALGTSVLYLIPGVPYINSVSDMLDGHYLCSFSRFMNAAILTFSLSAGLCGGLLLMNLRWF